MKKVLIILLTLALCVVSTACDISQNKSKEQWQTSFDINKVYFEELNNFLIEQYNKVDQESVSFYFSSLKNNNQIESLLPSYTEERLYIDDNIKTLFLNVKKAFRYDFSIITIDKNRISYYGEGNEMFVCSLDEKKPKTFWPDGAKANFSMYSLGDNWYYLFLKQR